MDLKPREIKVLKLICQEKSNLEIADKMQLGLRAIEKVKSRLYQKTKTKSAIGLFKWAVKNDYYTFKYLS